MATKKKGYKVTSCYLGFFERIVYFEKKVRARQFAKRERQSGRKVRITKY